MRSRMLVLIFLSLLLTFLPACAAAALSQSDRAAIYAAVVRQLYTVDHTFGSNHPDWPVVYLLRETDDTVGDPRTTRGNPSRLQESLQKAIVIALDDLPVELVWVDKRSEVIDESIMAVKDNSALITLGNIYPQGEGTVQVAASIYFASLAAGGTTYIVEQVDGIWEVTGNTGARWIS